MPLAHPLPLPRVRYIHTWPYIAESCLIKAGWKLSSHQHQLIPLLPIYEWPALWDCSFRLWHSCDYNALKSCASRCLMRK